MKINKWVMLIMILMVTASGLLTAQEQTAAKTPAVKEEPSEIKSLKEDIKLLQLKIQKLSVEMEFDKKTKELSYSNYNKTLQGILMELELLRRKQDLKIQPLKIKKEELSLEHAMKLAPKKNEKEELRLDQELKDVKFEQTLADLKNQKEKLSLENSIKSEMLRQTELSNRERINELKLEQMEISISLSKMNQELSIRKNELNKINQDLDLREKKKVWEKEANRDVDYPVNPFSGGVLKISDRRIVLDGPIIGGTAEYVNERIHFFNNRSEKRPIFIVINNSPGGSVMEGYRIVKGIDASKAPVHVVVKSFAASMAAVILSLADHSYAYPNALIMHHQPWGGTWGNLTVQKERLEVFKEWARRLHAPLAQKMGLTLEAFYKKMYEESATGDWEEFADNAVQYKWVDNIVTEIREEGVMSRPESEAPRPRFIFFGENKEKDEVQDYAYLPKPAPFDFYFMYDPQGYYRWK